MNELGNFYKQGELDTSKLVPAYQTAFSGWPWFEVSKCVDPNVAQRCVGGLSRIAVGATCVPCGNRPNQPAYEPVELVERFKILDKTRPTRWYVESVDDTPALAALAWSAVPADIAREKYSDVPKMQKWLIDRLGSEPIIWLDEVFADKTVRPNGNLTNFKSMCEGFMSALNNTQLAYRTINPPMIRAAEKNFNVKPDETAPDYRSLLKITGIL